MATTPIFFAQNAHRSPMVAAVSSPVVAMTMTVEFTFGSEIMANGFFLNNELTDFSFEPTRDGKPVANAPAPGCPSTPSGCHGPNGLGPST